jgi:hypothetical protein
VKFRLRLVQFIGRALRVPLYFGTMPWLRRIMPGKDRSRATTSPLTGRERHRRYRFAKQLAKEGFYVR